MEREGGGQWERRERKLSKGGANKGRAGNFTYRTGGALGAGVAAGGVVNFWPCFLLLLLGLGHIAAHRLHQFLGSPP